MECMTKRELFDKHIFFESKRKELAYQNNLYALKSLYDSGIPELPEMNSPNKWDFFAQRSFSIPDSVTLNRIKTVVDLVPNDANVLDFGCGYCYVLEEAKKQGLKWNYIGLDFSPGFIEKLKTIHPESTFVCGDISAVKGKTFDYILLLEVLEHIQPSSVLKFLGSLKNYLNPNGKVIISVPLYEDLQHSTCTCWKCGELGNVNGHVRSYTPNLVSAELTLSGYKVQQAKLIFAGTPLKRFVKKIMFCNNKPSNVVVIATS